MLQIEGHNAIQNRKTLNDNVAVFSYFAGGMRRYNRNTRLFIADNNKHIAYMSEPFQAENVEKVLDRVTTDASITADEIVKKLSRNCIHCELKSLDYWNQAHKDAGFSLDGGLLGKVPE